MHPGIRRSLLPFVLAGVLLAGQGCSGDHDDTPTPQTTSASDALGCGLLDEDLIVDAIGSSVTSAGTGLLPSDQQRIRVMTCTTTTVNSTVPFIDVSVARLGSGERAKREKNWPTSATELDCRDAWVAPGDEAYGAACVDTDAPPGSLDTALSSLWGNYSISVGIVRKKPRSDDAQTTYAISKDVYEHLQAG